MNRQKLLIEIVGWYGVVATIAAYFFVSYGMLGSSTFAYQALNFTGGIGLVVIALHKKDNQLVIVNAVWAIIALIAIAGIFLR